MIFINKGKEPNSLTQYKKQFNARFDNLPSDVKNDLRNALLYEQGYVCAYCMRRIPERDQACKIEHFSASTLQNELKYGNLLACCSGGELNGVRTCDTFKGNRVLHLNPQNLNDMNSISYRHDGTITSSMPYKNELSDLLNLNCEQLKLDRKQVIKNLEELLYRKLKNNNNRRYYLNTLLKHYKSRDEDNKFRSYIGVYIWYLEKKLRSLS